MKLDTKKHIELVQMLKDNSSLIKHSIAQSVTEKSVSNNLAIDPSIVHLLNLPVSQLSVFKDAEWDFNMDAVNPSSNVRGAKLKIDFSKYDYIPPDVIIELKCLFHHIYLIPKTFQNPKGVKGSGKKIKKGRRSRSRLKANTLISHFEAGMRFLNQTFKSLVEEYYQDFVFDEYKSLSDLIYSEFEEGKQSFTGAIDSTLKTFWNYMVHPNAEKLLGIKVDFNERILGDIKPKTKNLKKKTFFENSEFNQIVTHSSNRVMQFLLWQDLEEEIIDQKSLLFFQEHYKDKYQEGFKINQGLLNDYAVMRLRSKGYKQSFIKSVCTIPGNYLNDNGSLMSTGTIRSKIKEEYGIDDLDNLREQINEIYYASCYLICQFMGGRPEEISGISFLDSLGTRDDVPVILSNVGKSKFENLKLFDDAWVRIPIMDDAFRAAKLISVIYQNKYLLGNVDTFSPLDKNLEMQSTGICHFFNNYFSRFLYPDLDRYEKEKKIGFNPYFLRHTLAYQLHRMGVGLPLISFQLKHMVDGLEKFTTAGVASETTIDYGGISESLVSNHLEGQRYRKLAEIEKVKSIYDPDGTYIGKKGKLHKERIQKFFTGYMAAGYTKEDVFERLVDQGIAIIDVGTGFCGGGQEDFDESLPCIGTLRCNPSRCKHAVIGKVHIPKWKELYFVNKARLGKEQDPENKKQIQAVIQEAKTVLDDMGVTV